MDIAFYIAAIFGAVAVYLMMPAAGPKPKKLGALLALAAGGGLLLFLLRSADPGMRPSVWFYVFALLAAACALRVITHPRPVYSALYFVMVVLAAAGLFLVLEAEFMAFAMVIIYAGAILVTYLFVIMLATLPQTAGQEEQSPEYDRVAREPLAATAVGFAMLAVLTHVMFANADPRDLSPNDLTRAPNAVAFAVDSVPGRVVPLLEELDLIELADDAPDPKLSVVGDSIIVTDAADATVATIPVTDELRDRLATRVGNIDRVGMALFEGHPLGIELAGVILLLSMVGAIVIGRKRVESEAGPPGPDLAAMHADHPTSAEGVGEQTD